MTRRAMSDREQVPSRRRWGVAALALAALGVVGLWFYKWVEPTFPDSIWYSSELGEAGEAPDGRTLKALARELRRGQRVVVSPRRGSVEQGIRIVVGADEVSAWYVPTGDRRETDRGTWELCTLDSDQSSGWRVMR